MECGAERSGRCTGDERASTYVAAAQGHGRILTTRLNTPSRLVRDNGDVVHVVRAWSDSNRLLTFVSVVPSRL